MINYPFINKNYKEKISYKNRGLSFEERIIITNKYYLENNIALIYKRTTPIKVIDFDNKTKFITKAVFEKDSTTDFNGVYKGNYIDFEAKSTNSTSSFPLANLKEHQLKHLKNVLMNKGIAFVLIEFSKLNRIFFLKASDLLTYIHSSNKKSIPIDFIEKNGFLINQSILKPVDYLENIEKILEINKVFYK